MLKWLSRWKRQAIHVLTKWIKIYNLIKQARLEKRRPMLLLLFVITLVPCLSVWFDWLSYNAGDAFIVAQKREYSLSSLGKFFWLHFFLSNKQGVYLTNILQAAFLYLLFGFVIFWQKNIGVKAARKMLVKLAQGRERYIDRIPVRVCVWGGGYHCVCIRAFENAKWKIDWDWKRNMNLQWIYKNTA